MIHSKNHLIEITECTKACTYDQVYHYSADTYINEHSLMAARLSAGSAIEITERVVKGSLDNGFALVRPPGHHANRDNASGFCLFNNVALAAQHAIKNLGIDKVLIVDWDVHHGDGTQYIFEENPNVLYFSVHKYGAFFPGSGESSEVGKGPGLGRTVNVPFFRSGMQDRDYLTCFKHILLPIAKEFSPSLVIVSAGFDCAKDDLMSPMDVTTTGFEDMLSLLLPLANGKIVCVLEGGYTPDILADGVSGCIRVLLDKKVRKVSEQVPSQYCMEDLVRVVREHQKYWKCMAEKNQDVEWEQLIHRILFSGSL
jgi:histone deacetylase 6